MNSLWRMLAVMAVALVCLAPPPLAAQNATSGLRLVNASPDGPPIALQDADGATLIAATERNAVSGYVAVPPGPARLLIVPAFGAARPFTATLEPGQQYTLAMIGPMAAAQLQLFRDDSATGGQSVRLRLYHLSPDAPAVELAGAHGETLVAAVGFPDASAYVDLPAVSKVVIRPSRVTAPELAFTKIDAAPGSSWSVFVLNNLASISLRAVEDRPVAATIVPAALPATGAAASHFTPLALALGLLAAGCVLRRRANSR